MTETMTLSTTSPSAPRRIFRFGIGAGLLLALVGFVVGQVLGRVISQTWEPANGTNQQDLALVLGYVLGVVGWISGLGFLRYPIRRLRGQEPGPFDDDHSEEGRGRYFRLSTDHKVVGIQYIVGGLATFLIGGLNAMLIRYQLLGPDGIAWNPNQYLTIVSLHGSVMVMTMSALVLGGFGNYLVPLMIGSRRTAFPRIQTLSFSLFISAVLVIMSSVLVGGIPTGWTGYAPLGVQARVGMDSYYVAFALVAIALTLVGIDLMVTIITLRAPGMSWKRLPIFVWAVFATTIMMALASPMLLSTGFMGLLDRTIDTVNFVSPMGGSAFLYENLFWFFGHPEVYILAIPGFGIILEIIPVFTRRTLWGYGLAVVGMIGIAFMSFTVWQHHLFVSGINSDLRPFYSLSTELISIPTSFIFLAAFGTLWKGKIRFSVPMLFSLAFLSNFIIGGATGIFLSDVPSNATTHGSYFVTAHFHFTMMGGLVFAMFAAVYYWLPKMTGLRFREGLSKWHFWTLFIAFNSTFLPLFIAGARGMPRRVSSYDPTFTFLNRWASISAFCIFASMLIFLVNFVWSQFLKREPAEANPWDSRGLEWQVPTPVPAHNFDEIPVILSSPYEYGVPDAPNVADLSPTGKPDPRDENGNPIENPDRTPSIVIAGGRIFSLSTVFLFAAFVFSFFYLRSIDSHQRWNADDLAPGQGLATAILVAAILGVLTFGLVMRRINSGDKRGWQSLGIVATVLALSVIGLQIIQLATLGFEPSAGGYASVFVGWTIMLIGVEIGAAYWLLTLVAGQRMLRKSEGSPSLGAGVTLSSAAHLRASAQSYLGFYGMLGGVIVLAYVLLSLVH
ncbi:MAG: cbb3-type cytochrome c oxidase subunit I [Acidimicrobiia bacterium]|nr:cbb3-type cytochrome c oxidase subunit I [Acidimicrobiia bacterium]